MSYINVWIHLVWATKNRAPFLTENIRQKVFEHIKQKGKDYEIHIDFVNGYTDHIHLLISITSEQYLSKIVKLIKGESSYWINKYKLCPQVFEWQKQYFATSVGKAELERIRNYIRNQENHHSGKVAWVPNQDLELPLMSDTEEA